MTGNIILLPEILEKIVSYCDIDEIMESFSKENYFTSIFWIRLRKCNMIIKGSSLEYYCISEYKKYKFIYYINNLNIVDRDTYRQYYVIIDDKFISFVERFIAILPRASPEQLFFLFDEICHHNDMKGFATCGLITTQLVENLQICNIHTKHLSRFLCFYVSPPLSYLYQQHYILYGPLII